MRKQRTTGFFKQAALALMGALLRDTALDFILDLFDDSGIGQ